MKLCKKSTVWFMMQIFFNSSTLTGHHDFESGENYCIEVRSFDIEGARNHTLLTIKAPGAAAPGTGFSLVRHKPGMST
jgi:hypothetical protein